MNGIKRTKADAKMSDYIRWERDKGICQRCGKQYTSPAPGFHAAHCFGRRCPKCTAKNPKQHVCHRMDPANLLALCRGCHSFVDQNPNEREKLFRLRIGNDEFDRIAALAHGRRDRV
jgi:hypothetical protein